MGCTAILGDFTIGTGGPTGDGGADSAADGSIFKPLTCAPDNNRLPFQFSNFSVSNMSGGKWNGPIYFFDLGNHQARVVMDLSTNTGEVVETFTIDMEQGMVKGVPILEPGRLIAASREPGGTKISALIQDYSAGDVYVRSLADLGSTWDLQTPQNRVGGLGEFKGLCVREAVFGTAGADTFVVVATSTANNCNMADALTAYRLGLTPATAKWMVDASQFSAHGEQIAFDKDNMYVIGSGSSGGPPTSGASPNLYVAARDNLAVAPPTKLMLAQPTDIIDIAAIRNALEPGKANVMFFGGDLIGNGEVDLWVGKTELSTLGTFVAQKALAKTVVSGIPELPVNREEARWHVYTDSQNLLSVSMPFQAQGINFYWFDDKGTAVARYAGDTALLKDVPGMVAASADFLGPPLAKAVGEIGIAYVTHGASEDGGTAYSVWIAAIACVRK